MPETSTLLAFAAASLLLIAVPGPNVVLIASRAATEGRRSGLATTFGVEAATLVHIAAAAAGLSAIIARSATAFDLIRYAGAAYLLYLALRAWRDRGADAGGAEQRPARSARRAFADGFVVNMLNPKVAIFFLAFLPQFLDPARGPVAEQVMVLGAVFFVIACALDSGWAFAAGALGARLRSAAGLRRKVTAGVYLTLGVIAAAAGGRSTS